MPAGVERVNESIRPPSVPSVVQVMKRQKTLADVAARAGVSKMTASRALRGDKDVSADSKAKVDRAAKEIGYVGNHAAASLSSARSDLVGVVVPSLTNIVFAQVLSGVSDALSGTGLQPVFGITDYDSNRETEIIGRMLSWRPAGLILTGMEQSDEARARLEEAALPVVQIMDTDGDPIDSVVGFSHRLAGFEVAEALLEQGHSRFGYIGCNLDQDRRAAKRRDGFAEALDRSGLSFVAQFAEQGLSSVEAGRTLAAQMLDQVSNLDCIYFSNDDLAFGALCHCIDAGLSVPGRIALAGFNGLGLLNGFPGQITTSETRRREIGNAAAEVIVSSLRDKSHGRGQRLVMQPVLRLAVD